MMPPTIEASAHSAQTAAASTVRSDVFSLTFRTVVRRQAELPDFRFSSARVEFSYGSGLVAVG